MGIYTIGIGNKIGDGSIAAKNKWIKKEDTRSINHHEKNFVKNTIEIIKETIEPEALNILVSGREKKIYSTWKKMQKKNFNRFSKVIYCLV